MDFLVLAKLFLPDLISLAEGIYAWKAKSGADKQAFVHTALNTVYDDIAKNSTGGQAKTYADFNDSVTTLIDAGVEVAKTAGAFDDKQGYSL